MFTDHVKPVALCVIIHHSTLLVDSVTTTMSLNILRHSEEQQENSTRICKKCQFPATLGSGPREVIHLWQLHLEKTELFKTDWGIITSWALSKVCAQRQSLQHTKSMATECSCDNESKYIVKISKADPKLKNCSFLVNYQAIILTAEAYFSDPLKNTHHY